MENKIYSYFRKNGVDIPKGEIIEKPTGNKEIKVDKNKLVVKVNGTERDFTMVNGIATVAITGLEIGNYEVNVTFKGDDKYVAKDNNGTTFKVTATDTYKKEKKWNRKKLTE